MLILTKLFDMNIYQVFLLFWFGGSVTSETNGLYFQQPSVKWAIAHSYSWVIEPRTFEPASNYRRNYETLQNQAQQQPQQMEAQPRQQAQHQIQQQAALQDIQQRALQNIRQAENVTPGTLPSNDISNPSTNFNSYSQEFVDEIVGKVMLKTTSDSYLGQPPTRGDIEKIVREVLLENPLNERVLNRMNQNRDYSSVSDKYHGSTNHVNRNGFPQSYEMNNHRHMKYFTNYPTIQTVQTNPQTDCTINCGNVRSDGQPIAVAMANTFRPDSTNRLTKERMVDNSFTYTSV